MNATDLYNLQNSVIIDLRSLLLSAKDGLTERELINEYKSFIGAEIPYIRLGFNSLYDFLQDLASKNVVRQQRSLGGLLVYHAYDDNCTYQVRNLVKGQVDSKKHERDQRRSRELVYQRNRMRLYSGAGGDPGAMYNPLQLQLQQPIELPYYIQNNIVAILKKAANQTLSRSAFTRSYYQTYNDFININKYGYTSIKVLLESLKNIIEIRACVDDEFTIHLKEVPQQQQLQPSEVLAPATVASPADDPVVNELNKLDEMHKLENEIIDNLKSLITHFNDKGGIWTHRLLAEYRNMFKKDLNAATIGYRTVIDILDEKLGKFVRIKRPEQYGDYLLFCRDANDSSRGEEGNADGSELVIDQVVDSNSEDAELIFSNNLRHLAREIRQTFKRDTVNFSKSKLFKIVEFKELFEARTGWKFYLKDYGCKTLDQLVFKLVDERVFEFKRNEAQLCIKYRDEDDDSGSNSGGNLKNYSSSESTTANSKVKLPKTTVGSTNSEIANSGLELEKNHVAENAIFLKKFFREHVFYHETLDVYKILDDIDLSQEHNVMVSYMMNPFDISIQFCRYISKLNELMDDLEGAYLGVGSSHYNMKREYIRMGKYCAAVFPGDKNWHRCKILEIEEKRKMVRVAFIDYGGEASVPINELKFLCRKFINMPQQALQARLTNVTFLDGNTKWKEGITEYLLSMVRNKTFKARIDGCMHNFLCVTLFELNSAGKRVGNLNNRIIKDGYAALKDDRKIMTPIENSILNRFIKKKQDSETVTTQQTDINNNNSNNEQTSMCPVVVNNDSDSSTDEEDKYKQTEKPHIIADDCDDDEDDNDRSSDSSELFYVPIATSQKAAPAAASEVIIPSELIQGLVTRIKSNKNEKDKKADLEVLHGLIAKYYK